MRWWTLLILAVVLVGLIMWDSALTQQQSVTRQASARIASILDEDVFRDRPIVAIRLDLGENDPVLYYYEDGMWRCERAHGAPAENELIEAILPAILSSEGVVRTENPDDAAEFGFHREHTVRISFSGAGLATDPTGDVIYALDVGRSITRTGGSYVRPVGTQSIWEIDADLRAIIGVADELEQNAVPPMLDPHLVPQVWPGVRLGPQRIVIDRRGAEPITITRRDSDEADSERQQWEWVVTSSQGEFLGDVFQVTSYAVFITRAPYAGVIAPRDPAELGLDEPLASIVFETAEGPQLQLLVGGLSPRGGIVVYNSFTRNLYELEPEIAQRLLPSVDLLLGPEQGNPWEQWMRR